MDMAPLRAQCPLAERCNQSEMKPWQGAREVKPRPHTPFIPAEVSLAFLERSLRPMTVVQ